MDKMTEGLTRIGHIVSMDEGEAVASVTFDDRGVVMVLPHQLEFVEAMQRNGEDRTVEVLAFKDTHGGLLLRNGRKIGSRASSSGTFAERLRFVTALATGALDIAYVGVNGMTSEVDGLAVWAAMSSISFGPHHSEGRVTGFSIHAENPPARDLGGPLDLTLNPSFKPSLQPNVGYSISEALRVRTTSSDLVDWNKHAATHHMIQDLMCLVYGKAISSRLVSVMREDDQLTELQDERRWWVDAYEPTFGRGHGKVEPLGENARPLFYLDEANPGKVSTWLDEFDSWSRPTWIAVTTLFQRDSTVEARLLQMGVALEALGYAVWRRANPSKSTTPSYLTLLGQVTDAVGFYSPAIYGDESVEMWRDNFNKVFKGAKHADNPLPDSGEAYVRSGQAFALIRCWLGIELGVDPNLLIERLVQ